MFKLIDKKNNCREYIIFKNKILCNSKKGLIYGDSIVYKPKNEYISFFKIYNDNVYLFENERGLIYFDLRNYHNIKKINFIDGVDYFINENDVIVTQLSDDYLSSDKIRINLETLEKRWTIKSYFGSGKIFNDAIFSVCKGGKICKISLTTPQTPQWQFDLTQLGTYSYGGDDLPYKVVKFIGIWQNILLVQLSNSRIIALDVTTGNLLHDIKINKTTPITAQGVYYDQYIKMHLVENKIIWLTNQTLLQVDLNTFTVRTIKEFYSLPRENQWRFMHNTYKNGKIYFTADYAWQYVTPSYVGVMDAHTGEILWHQQLENTGGLPEAPKVTNNKLYIRTNTKTLHIFEKTQNETA